MVIDDIIRITKRLCDDDQSITNSDLTDWIDMGIDAINQQIGANIDHITGQPTNTTSPNFDSRYHQSLVDFCVMQYRLGDSDYNAAAIFEKKFGDMLALMQRDMPLNPSVRKDDYVLQLVAADTSGIFDTSALDSGVYFNVLLVYQNDKEITQYCRFDYVTEQMTVDTGNAPIAVNDKITIVFEENPALNNPPFDWWRGTGW